MTETGKMLNIRYLLKPPNSKRYRNRKASRQDRIYKKLIK